MTDFSVYSIEEHTHRFGLWTAARAASTSRFSNSEVASFIKNCQLKESLEKLRSAKEVNHETYKNWFLEQANSVNRYMNEYEHEKGKKRKKTFGIAAKIVSIYVKSVEVIPSKGNSRISLVAFPPIDRYLLLSLRKGLPIENVSWSDMEAEEFMSLVDKLKTFVGDMPFWKIEYYWDLNEKAASETSSV